MCVLYHRKVMSLWDVHGRPASTVELFNAKIGCEYWRATGKYVDVVNPVTGKHESAPVYKIIIDDILQNFAAIRINKEEDIWAFYL